MRSAILFLGVFASALSGAVDGHAQTPLREQATAEANRGWEAVGRLNIGESGFCTGSLITSDIVITAAHCLFEGEEGTRVDPAKISFQAGLRSGRAEATRGVRRVVVHPDYDFGDRKQVRQVGADLALLELDAPVRVGHVRSFRTQVRIAAGQAVQVVSYARDRADAPSREDRCNIVTRDAEILVLDCNVDFGASGAPVFARVGAEMRIVSVISAKGFLDGKTVSLAAVMEGQLEKLIQEFARTPALSPQGTRTRVETSDLEIDGDGASPPSSP